MSAGAAVPAFATVRLAFDAEGHVATLLLDRPEARNAIDRRMAAELRDACAWLAAGSVRAAIVSGAGDRAFCAGADLRERLGLQPEERAAHTAAIAAAAEALAAVPVPTIAAIRGYALAGGAELALACDLRVAATDARLGFPEVRVGIFPGAGGVVRLPAVVGAGAARDLLFTGRQVGAEEAFRIGLVNRLTDPDRVLAVAREIADEIASNAPLAVRALKRALQEAAGLPPERAREVVDAERAPLDGTRDYGEGLLAFAERRAPRFRGE